MLSLVNVQKAYGQLTRDGKGTQRQREEESGKDRESESKERGDVATVEAMRARL